MDENAHDPHADVAATDRLCHGLRQPVSVIRAFAELLEDEIAGPLNEGQLDYVRTIVRAAEDLERCIQAEYDRARAAAASVGTASVGS